jgi:hypothetical protein
MNEDRTCAGGGSELTQPCSGFDLENTRRGLIALRVKYGSETAIGHRCSNLVEINQNLLGATGEQRKNLLTSMAKQAGQLETLLKTATPVKPHKNVRALNLARLREVLDYDPLTGALTWRTRLSPMCKFGEPAGIIKAQGYRKITIDERNYTASHLAWFHYYGVAPDGLIDHKNGNKADDRIENLRPATHAENSRNMGRNSANTTGFKGVAVFNKPGEPTRYRALIRANGERHFLGIFDTPEEAHAAYCRAAELLHGEFARTH